MILCYYCFDLVYKIYIQVSKTDNQVTYDHTRFVKYEFNLEVDKENKKLPNI